MTGDWKLYQSTQFQSVCSRQDLYFSPSSSVFIAYVLNQFFLSRVAFLYASRSSRSPICRPRTPIGSKWSGLLKRIIWVTFSSIIIECWKRFCFNVINWILWCLPAMTKLRKCSSSQAWWYKSSITTCVRKFWASHFSPADQFRALWNLMLYFSPIQLSRRVSMFFWWWL